MSKDRVHTVDPATAGAAQGTAALRAERGAVLSADGRYRYRLWRAWDDGARNLWFVMLNPSTADADIDDPTIRKCVGFAKRWGMGGITVLNLFAYRSTDPKHLPLAAWNAKGADNDLHLNEAFHRARMNHEPVIAAWGQNAFARPRARTVAAMARTAGASLLCLAKNGDGSPKHPLYVPYTASPLPLSDGAPRQDAPPDAPGMNKCKSGPPKENP